MKKKKLFAAVLCLALVLVTVLPMALADSDETVIIPVEPVDPVSEEITDPVPLDETPAEEVIACTCDPQPAEGEAHQVGCPLYTEPAAELASGTHDIATCYDGCTDSACACGCHLFDRVMAATTLDEIWYYLESASDSALAMLTDEQNAAIDAKITALEPEPAPAIEIGTNDEIVPSVIEYPLVSFTDVAPLGEPVTGGR